MPLALQIGASLPKGFGPTDQDLSLSQGFDFFNKRSALRALGASKILEARADEARVLLEIQSEAAVGFIEATAARDSLAVAKELSSLSQELLKAAARRFEEGRVPEVQAARAKIELERSLLNESAWSARYAASLKRLSSALGVKEVSGVEGEASLPSGSDLSRRPDLLILKAKAQSADAEVSLAKSSLMPTGAVSLHRAPWEEDSRLGLRLQLSWNLLDGGRAKSERAAAQAKKAAFDAAYHDALAQAEAEASALDLEIEAGRKEVVTLEGLTDGLKELTQKTRRGFEEGVGTMVEVLESIRALREVEIELISARKNVSLLQAARLSASGSLLEAMK